MKMRRLRPSSQGLVLAIAVLAAAGGGFLRVLTMAETPTAVGLSSPQIDQAPQHLFWAKMAPSFVQVGNVPSFSLGALFAAEPRLQGEASAGRLDPFAPIIENPRFPKASQPTAASPAPVQSPQNVAANTAPPGPLPVIPITAGAPLPPLPQPNWGPPLSPLPAIPQSPNPVAVMPSEYAAAPLSPIEAIEVSGVIQLPDRVGIIAREVHGKTSRHLFPGDTLANGQIILKSIDMSAQEPLIILEYQGQEYPRIVGSGGLLGIS